jgi:hypothetical protein
MYWALVYQDPELATLLRQMTPPPRGDLLHPIPLVEAGEHGSKAGIFALRQASRTRVVTSPRW